MTRDVEPLWTPSEDPHVAIVEARLTGVGSAFLYRVHVDAFTRTGLPAPNQEALRATYRADDLPDVAPFAKADGGSMARAERLFRALTRRGVKAAKDARDLANAVTLRWWGEGRLESQAQANALQAFLIGRVQAGLADPRARERNLEAAMRTIVGPDPEGLKAAEFAQARAGELITNLRDETRKQVALTLLDAEIERLPAPQLASRLSDRFATLNRDWRRVAITESSANRSHGFLAGLEPGEEVEWNAERTACRYCRRYHGRRFVVVGEPDEARFHEVVWAGKSNAGRSFHPRTIDGRERTLDELAGPTIPAHPHCRCGWIRVGKRDPRVDADFGAYLDHLLRLA